MRALGLLVALSSACSFAVRGVEVEVAEGQGDAALPGVFDAAIAIADLSQPPTLTQDAALAHDLATSDPHVGDACSGSSCGMALACMAWLSGGYCSRPCLFNSDCPIEAACVDIGSGPHMCMLKDSAKDCARNTLSCRDCGGASNVCAPSGFCDGC